MTDSSKAGESGEPGESGEAKEGLTTLKLFRVIAMVEGLSFLILLGIAMPLKYFMGLPQAVRMVGMAHGILFLLYLWMLMQSTIVLRWSLQRAGMYFVASMVPFAAFWVDRKLAAELAARGAAAVQTA